MLREIKLERMHPQEIRKEMKRTNLLYVPIAPLEWHSLHLPYGTDPLNAYSLCLKLARITGGLVHPIIYAGTEVARSPEQVRAFELTGKEKVIGMDFPGLGLKSFYLSPSSFKTIIREHIKVMKKVGFKNIVLMRSY